MKKIVIILSLIFFTTFSFANEKEELKQHFLNKIDEIIFVVKDHTISKEERNGRIVEVVTPMFDFTLMAKLSLGKKWRGLNKKDKQEFVELYVSRMKKSYSSKLDAYSNEKVKVTDIKKIKSNKMVLLTDLINGSEKLQITYKLYKPKKIKKNKDKWLIYDVEILGVSILKTDRAQFKEYLKNKTIQDLMNKMKKS